MQEKLNELKARLKELALIGSASATLRWDQQTQMPKGGAATRGEVLAYLGKTSHEKFTSDEVGKLLESLAPWAAEQADEDVDARLIKYVQWSYDRSAKVPSAYVLERSQKMNAANQAWQEARKNSDFAAFQPHMENVLDLVKRYANFFKPYDHPYDVLVDQYEKGMTTDDIKALFDSVRPKQVALIEAIAGQPQVDASILRQHFPIEKQIEVGREITEAFGYDFNRGRQDSTTHPFATNLGYGDQRITYRADENFLNPYLFAIMHESGHAMYEQGVSQDLWGTPLYRGTSSGIHESQSRLWENLVGRSKPFWQWYYPKLQAHFPSQLGNVKLNDFYKAINRVEPSLIRVEADEATYNLHIMLRMEIEIALLDGEFEVKDLPEVWNSTIKSYLGVDVPNDTEGVLQDVHWSWGLYGQFSAYALGNIAGAQIWEVLDEQVTDVNAQIAKGEFGEILGWLQTNIYQHGKIYDPQELMQRVTGNKMNGDAYVRYLEGKFGDIYEL